MYFTNINTALPSLARAVLDGPVVDSRNGTTHELIHQHVTLTDPLQREILVPARKASLPAQIAESAWVLAGRDDMEFLSNYLPRARDFSDDGLVWRGAYGRRLRAWPRRNEGDVVDQLAWVVDLLRRDPLTRRAVMTIYDPDVDSASGKDIPCNNWLHFQNRAGALHLHVATRSNDLMWGWSGINAFEWSVLLEVVAGLVGLNVGQLHFSISSLHLYEKHWAKAERIATRETCVGADAPTPRFSARAVSGSLAELDETLSYWFLLEGAIRSGQPAAYREINTFPEPMLQSWLRVLAWWWSRDPSHLEPLKGTALYHAALLSPERITATPTHDVAFKEFVTGLHAEKHAVYGNSWKKRGETIGILANIARKIDRLGLAGGGDTAADTVIDLLCYLAKYRLWLTEAYAAPSPFGVAESYPGESLVTDLAEPVTDLINAIRIPRETWGPASRDLAIRTLKGSFQALEAAVGAESRNSPNMIQLRVATVDKMLPIAAQLAYALWSGPDYQNPYRNVPDDDEAPRTTVIGAEPWSER